MNAATGFRSASALLAFSALLCAGCAGPRDGPDRASAATADAYVPGFGEIMSFQQMRHIKLWFAGRARNWDLAAYEIDELTEGFDDVVAYHPTLGHAPVAPRDMVPQLVTDPLDSLRASVERGDEPAFGRAYGMLTQACNDCHQAMEFGFNVVQTPTSNPYTNQVFERP
ncbi:MAG: hypothetical protein PVJ80_01410 [Gemmatimonadota bacterium]|jgi:hypothetical protein